jgi:CRISPR-associated protein Csy2
MSLKFKTPDAVLVLNHLRLINCNTISSPLTWGFPAISAFAGFTEALNIKVQDSTEYEVQLCGVGVVCHAFDPQVNKADGSFETTFKQTRNPLEKKGAKFVSASLQEEGRCHIEVSIIIGIYGDLDDLDEEEEEEFKEQIYAFVQTMRIAGGSILPFEGNKPFCELESVSPNKEKRENQFRSIRSKLMPGFTLVSRTDVLRDSLKQKQDENPESTGIDVLLDHSRLTSRCVKLDSGQEDVDEFSYEWRTDGKSGWLVPIPVGYVGISRLYNPGEVANCRDMGVPSQFVECVYSLGEWLSPHRISELNNLLWFYDYHEDEDLYLLVNNYPKFINN